MLVTIDLVVRSMRMRLLPALLLVACRPTAPAPAPAAPTPAPATPPAALAARCPVGDMTHVAVYTFLEAALADAAARDEGRARTRELVQLDAELRGQADLKPPRASIVERELSHVLTTLCDGTPGCRGIGLYNTSGLAIALSSTRATIAPIGFDDGTWARLTRAQEGERFDLGGDTYVVFPAKHGVALCIVDAAPP